MEERSVHVEVHRKGGVFWARVEELPGCFASGETLGELLEALEEAIGMMLEPEDRETFSVVVRVTGLDLSVAERLLPPEDELSNVPFRTPQRRRDPHSRDE
jgi:predicted RNase H-like HicB family nuclease